MLLHAPTYLTNRSVRSLRARSLWLSGGRSAEIEPLTPSPSLTRFWSIPGKRDNAIIPGFFDASLNFYFLFFTLSLSLSLSWYRDNWYHYNSTHDAFRSVQKKFMLVKYFWTSMQRLLNPIFNVVNYRLWVILKNDLAFCSGFGTYRNQSSFFPLNALQLVWFGCGLPPLRVSITGLFWGLFALFLPCQELNWRADALINTLYSRWDQRSSLNVVLFTRRP